MPIWYLGRGVRLHCFDSPLLASNGVPSSTSSTLSLGTLMTLREETSETDWMGYKLNEPRHIRGEYVPTTK